MAAARDVIHVMTAVLPFASATKYFFTSTSINSSLSLFLGGQDHQILIFNFMRASTDRPAIHSIVIL
jgi:hypothetical protein